IHAFPEAAIFVHYGRTNCNSCKAIGHANGAISGSIHISNASVDVRA
ncbi:MAG: hypothetical protein RL745_98, partial [Actinomycetota bacterium]